MKKSLFTLIVLSLCSLLTAQFIVWRNGQIIFELEENNVDSITFYKWQSPDNPDTPTESEYIIVKAKVPSSWDDVTAWVWATDEEGREVRATRDGDWWVITAHCEELNVIFKNGWGWNGDVNQTEEITGIRENTCYQLKQIGAKKATATAVDCPNVTYNLEIEEDSIFLLSGETQKISYTLTPEYANGIFDAEFISSDENVVSIEDGVMKGLSAGTANVTIKVKANEELTATFVVRVAYVDEGVYVVEEDMLYSVYDFSNYLMADGINENSNTIRDGMYEKYIALEAGKPFQILVVNNDGTHTVYGAELTEVALYGYDQPEITIQRGKMIEYSTMQVPTDGLYHIVLDLNLDGSLEDKLILVAPVEWGVRGGMNGWGFTTGTRSEFNKTTMTYTWEGQHLDADGEFKFSYGGWKIELNALADDVDHWDPRYIKAYTCLPQGENIRVTDAGIYNITLTYTLTPGDIANSYQYEVTLIEKDPTPTEMYMIGADFGSWDWASAGVVSLTPVHSKPGEFWTIKYFNAGYGFKFCSKKEWNGDFTNLGEDAGFTVADGSCFVPADGLYMVYVNLTDKKLTIEPATVYGIGDSFGAWDDKMENAKFAVSEDGKSLTMTIPADGNLRMYAESTAATSDWWTREFNVFEGKIEYRGNGGDQAAVPVTAGQVITLNFADDSGSIQ